MATPALCCLQALRDATARWPKRDRSSDGIMGDSAHQARKSDHNDGNAFDLTYDPAQGVDCGALSLQVINDNRVTYVIWNRQIYNRARTAEGWRPYNGLNPHTHHMHVSIKEASRDDLSPWPWSASPTSVPVAPSQPVFKGHVVPSYPGTPLRQPSQLASTPNQPVLRAHAPSYPGTPLRQGGQLLSKPNQPAFRGHAPSYPGTPLHQGSQGIHVRTTQQRLRELGYSIAIDGNFGFRTREAVVAFQRTHNLLPDGIVGPRTWAVLLASK